MAEIRIDPGSLEQFVAAIFEKADFTPEDAATEAHVLVWANVRGVDSHGVLRVHQYLANIRRGDTVVTTGASGLSDGQRVRTK